MLCLSFLFGYITVSIIAMAEHSAGMGVFFLGGGGYFDFISCKIKQ